MWSLRNGVVWLCGLLLGCAAGASQAQPPAFTPMAANDLDPRVLRLAIEAVDCAQRMGQPRADRLAVIDYSRPSTERRLWVFDLHSGELLIHDLVAHGRGSGDREARRFSNVSQSYTSSLGLFRALDPYQGANGYSLRLQGLEPGINDGAYARQIVIHGADYVSPQFIQKTGRIGRSYGCPAVRHEVARPLIDALRGGQYLYAYAPDASWAGTPASLGCHNAEPPIITAAQNVVDAELQPLGLTD